MQAKDFLKSREQDRKWNRDMHKAMHEEARAGVVLSQDKEKIREERNLGAHHNHMSYNDYYNARDAF